MDRSVETGNLKRKGKYKSREHTKREKREQRKRWLKRKREKNAQMPVNQHVVPVLGDDAGNKTKTPQRQDVEKNQRGITENSRGKQIVNLSLDKTNKKRKAESPKASPKKFTKAVDSVARGNADHKANKAPSTSANCISQFREINRSLLVPLKDKSIGSGTFGDCFLALYRGEFQVAVKEMKCLGETSNGDEMTKREVLHEAEVISALGDHPGLPHLFGICTESKPHCLILQFHHVDCRSLTLFEAASMCTILTSHLPTTVSIVNNISQTLSYIHSRGFLHNDLKGNNVVLEKRESGFVPIIIDFGKSIKICKAKLRKPKLDVEAAMRKYPHIAPEIHRGERQTISSDVFSFGYLVHSFTKKTNFKKRFYEIVKKCTSSCPSKRPSLTDVNVMFQSLN